MLVIGAVLLTAVIAMALADNADAKGNMRAVLDQPIPAESVPGEMITVKWKLEVERPSNPGHPRTGQYEPFGAGEVFVRLIGPAGSQPTETVVDGQGHFSAAVRVPTGGVKAVKIGIKGVSTSSGGSSQASDYLIPISGPTVTNPTTTETNQDAGLLGTSQSTTLTLLGILGLLTIFLAARRFNSRRNTTATAAS